MIRYGAATRLRGAHCAFPVLATLPVLVNRCSWLSSMRTRRITAGAQGVGGRVPSPSRYIISVFNRRDGLGCCGIGLLFGGYLGYGQQRGP
jgi:hypothetical protein